MASSITNVASTTFSRSLPSNCTLSEASIAQDLAMEADDWSDESETDSLLSYPSSSTPRFSISAPIGEHAFTGLCRRASLAGPIEGLNFHWQGGTRKNLTRGQRQQALREERSLLRDNNLIQPKHQQKDNGHPPKLFSILSIPKQPPSQRRLDSEPSEISPLLGDPSKPYGGQSAEAVDLKWEEAILAGAIRTTWQREAIVIARYSGPLVLTFLLQFSIPVASVFTVGHLGTVELAAVSLSTMTANVTGYAVYQGLTTSLDTLCAQAYGSGRRKLVGLQLQRMVYFLWLVTIFIGIIWVSSYHILRILVPDDEVAALASQYLKIIIIGAPGYAAFESGKRFAQAQGLFSACLCVLLIMAPLNAIMHWLFVWKFAWGYVGAPIAVATTTLLLPVVLFIYIRLDKKGMSCWNGFSWKALQNWGPMIRLALPGLLMIEAECLAFETLTFAASYFGTTALAAQSILATISTLAFQIPFSLSIAGSTRIANMIGATLVDAAKITARVTFVASIGTGLINLTILATWRKHIPYLFTENEQVAAIVTHVLPLFVAFQLFDSMVGWCNGVLRGLGRQRVGGYVQLFCYYCIALPISFGLAFGAGKGILGLWTGVAIALGLVFLAELVYLSRTDWQQSVEEAKARDSAE